MRTDFERMPLPELVALEAKVRQAKLMARERERKALALRVREMCSAYGTTPNQLFGAPRKTRNSLNAKLRAGAERFLDAMGEKVRSNGRRRKKSKHE